MSIELLIDKEFSGRCPPLDLNDEFHLRQSLEEEGCRDPVVYWQQNGKPPKECPIIDGHNRYRICRELGIDYPVAPLQLPSRTHVLCWIISTQLSRRNLSPVQKSQLRFDLHRLKTEVAQTTQTTASGVQPGPSTREDGGNGRKNGPANRVPVGPPAGSVVDQVAKETGVSRSQVKRDVRLGHALEVLDEHAPKLREAALKGRFPKRVIMDAADAPGESLAAIEAEDEVEWGPALSALADSVAADRKRRVQEGKPSGLPSEFDTFFRAAEALVRAKTAIYEACGHSSNPKAVEHEGTIRDLLNQIFDEATAWKKEVEEGSADAQEGYGKCPNCAGVEWTEDDDGAACSRCHHPHGEPAGDVDASRLDTQRRKTTKTAEALQRAFDDLQFMRAKEVYDDATKGCKRLLSIAKGWK